ncbi:MAG: TetR/AcrR family transcriptional regulator, partial [Mesorhizobium sp.]
MATDTRTRMIEATALLLRRRGYHGTSLNDILTASGAPRGSLYFHFPGGKDQLVIEVTRASVADVTERLGAQLATESDPAVAVHHIYQSVARMLEDNEFSLGCPIAPVVLDAPNDVPELEEICRSAFEQWIGLLRQ